MTNASEAKYRRLFEGMQDGYVRTDLDGKIQEFNAAYLKIHGYSEEELLSMTYMDLTPDKWRSMEAEIMKKQTLANGYSELYEKESRRKDDTLVPIELRAYLERDEDNKPVGYWATVRDISNRKRSEEALRNSELKYRQLSEQSFQGIVLIREAGIVFVNQAFADIAGISIEEALNMNMEDIWEMIHPDDRCLLIQGFADMFSGQKMPPRAEFRLFRKDGGVRLVEGYAITTDFDGEATVQAVVLDITEKKQTEEELRESEYKYHMLFNTSRDGIAFTNMDGAFLEVNDAFSDMIGYSQEELLSMDYTQITPDRWREREQDIHKTRVMQRGYSDEYEKEYVRKDGAIIPATIRTWLVRDENGKPAYVIATTRDITDRKRAEDELRESEEKHRTLVNSMQDLVLVYDEDDRNAQVYAGSEDMLYVSPEEFVTKRIVDVLPKRVSKNYVEKVKKVRATGNADTTDYWLEIGDETRWFSTILSRHEDGKSVVAVVRDITDRKMAENALKERESFLANIFASIQDGISILDKDLRIIQVNRKMEEWYEHTMPLVGKKCYKAYHERERACEVCPTQQTLESGETALEVVPKRGPGGSIVGWLDLYSFPLYDSEHKLIGVIEYVRDITERHRAEEALKQSERQHRTLVSNIPGAVYRCELDDDWTMLFLSDRFQDITGYPSADIIANQTRSYESIIHPDDRESVRDGVNRSVKQKKPFTLEYRILHANGEVRWVHENGQAIFDQDGSVLHLDGVILDVTEQRIAEDALRQSEQMYRALFESANDAILIMKDTLFLECNDIALEMFGCNREEILFHSPDEFSPKLQPDGGPSKKSALKRIRAALAGEPQFFEWKHTRCDGAFFDAEVGLNAVQLGDDLVIQAIVRDITDRKRAEKEIKTTAEAASLYLDLMGHDIRNHLQAIVMGTEILTSTGLDVDQSFVINLITESVERSRDLIHKVQETQGLLSAALSKRSLKGALKNSLEVLKETYEDLEIEVDYEIRRAIINADQYLVNLLVNLLENAVIHNNKRPRRVWVTLREAKGGFEISIADNGPGISDEKKENLFDPERRFGGVGIHQALRIAQKYDGHINVDDRVANDSSQGAKFQLWLPKQDTSAS